MSRSVSNDELRCVRRYCRRSLLSIEIEICCFALKRFGGCGATSIKFGASTKFAGNHVQGRPVSPSHSSQTQLRELAVEVVQFIHLFLNTTMADVRSLLKNERAARRIQHKYASYSTTGTLLCTVCHLQLKSEALWDGHLRSAGHIVRLQKAQDSGQDAAATSNGDGNKKKRKASESENTIRKRTKAADGLPEGFFDVGKEPVPESKASANPTPPTNEIQIPSRPATPSKTVAELPKRGDVNEDEWAAFEADIAAAEFPTSIYDNGVISAPAMSAAELATKEKEEDNWRKRDRHEAELEGDKEDAVKKLEDEFEEMESLEQRVKRLKEKREALRNKESFAKRASEMVLGKNGDVEDVDDDEDEDDDWNGFRMKG
jgi:zinc finger protein 830